MFLLFISPTLLIKGYRENILTDSFRGYTATLENYVNDNGTGTTSLALTHYADAHRSMEALQNMSLTLLEWSTLFRSASADLIDVSQDTVLSHYDGAEAMCVAVAEYAHQVDETARHFHEFHLHIWNVGQSMSIDLWVLARKLERHGETSPFWRAFDTTGFR
jgi:arginyl-tRNA synthetase